MRMRSREFRSSMPRIDFYQDPVLADLHRGDPQLVSPCPGCGKTRAVPVDNVLRCLRCGRERADALNQAIQIPAEAYGSCRSCHGPVIWVTTERGKKMPLDREEVLERGALLFVIDEKGVAHRSQTGRGRHSHFFTCPQRDQWRKERR